MKQACSQHWNFPFDTVAIGNHYFEFVFLGWFLRGRLLPVGSSRCGSCFRPAVMCLLCLLLCWGLPYRGGIVDRRNGTVLRCLIIHSRGVIDRVVKHGRTHVPKVSQYIHVRDCSASSVSYADFGIPKQLTWYDTRLHCRHFCPHFVVMLCCVMQSHCGVIQIITMQEVTRMTTVNKGSIISLVRGCMFCLRN